MQKLLPNHLWRVTNSERKLFLTFDDGPTPEVTGFILETLDQHKATATFFCLGENLKIHKGLGQEMQNRGHLLANHGYSHLDGWKIPKNAYNENIERGETELNKFKGSKELVFRPPYGHFRGNKKTVLWSLMSGDFDDRLPKEKCLSLLMSRTKSGDIIVFHDNKKAFVKLKWVLPRFLDFCTRNGFQFELIPNEK